jgi:hypothetical protein
VKAALVLLAFLSGCAALQPKAGDACKPDDAVCAEKGALVCRGGRYVPTSCNGPVGCRTAKDRTVTCDQTAGVRSSEPCFDEGAFQCAADAPESYLGCRGGAWELQACPSGRLCKLSGGNVTCE